MQRAWLRGVGVDAPAQWKRNHTRCGTPLGDTLIVEYTGEATAGCLITNPPTGLSVVDLSTSRANDEGVRYEHATIDGVAVETATRQTDDGRAERLVYFPDRGVNVSITSPDTSVVDAAYQSLQVVQSDPASGCVVHTNAYDDGRPPDQGGGQVLLPGDPTSADACVYVDDWLESTAHLTGDKLATLINAVRAAPPTTKEQAPDDAGCESVAGMQEPSDNPPMLLRFDGPDGHWMLVAKISWCTRWQSTISSGSATRRIDQQLLLALPPVWMSYPDPDSMDIG